MRKTIEKRVTYLEKKKEKLVIDADTHITDMLNLHPILKKQHESTENYFHGKCISAEDLLAEMKMAEVDMCLVWQNPAGTFYPGGENENFHALMKANEYIFQSSKKYENRFIPSGWTDPEALGMEKALELVDVCVKKFGFPIVKLNPAQNQFPIDSEGVFKIVDRIVALGATPAFHYGADTPFTPAHGLEKVAGKYAPNQIIAVHMGGGGASYMEADAQYIETREMGLRNPNIKFIESAKRDTHMESDFITYQFAGKPFYQNICCASDAPYSRQTWNFGGFRAMFKSLLNSAGHTDERVGKNPGVFNERSVQGYMGGNFAEIAIAAYQNILPNF